jgi:hypothetical protein
MLVHLLDIWHYNMGIFRGPKIVTDGLVLALDASSPRSYPGTGTTWSDLTPNSLDATLYNGMSYSTDNHGTMVLDGVDDYAQISSSPLTAITVFTFELWINRTGIATTTAPYDRIFQKEGGVSGYPAWGWHIGEDVSAAVSFLSAYGDGTTLNNSISFSTAIELNEWNCLATTLDSNLLASNYINGVLTNSGTLNNTPMNTEDTILIGIGDNREFKGKISTVKVYNRALTADEIFQNYNALKSRFGL